MKKVKSSSKRFVSDRKIITKKAYYKMVDNYIADRQKEGDKIK